MSVFHRSHDFLFGRRRTTYALLIAVLALAGVAGLGSATLLQQLAVLCWKLLLVGVAVFVAHLLRRQQLPYVDLSALFAKGELTTAEAVVFLGTVLWYGIIIFSLTQGL